MQQKLIIYTDGACKGNPGIGGWGAILFYGEHKKELYGYASDTTNNRMELTAVIEALKALNRSCEIEIYTDSQYVKRGITEWIHGWLRKNWKDVKNPDLWQELLKQTKAHTISWHWVRGHNGDINNERADELANLAITEAGSSGS
ncbi:ribonuclease HI [Aquella oligotrophica]|uniref:Ribonuclease H n=1 Tax=Aquella oligotrophica TaxID=2067065 RepID=A0A2I7N6A5_9NEIS|nr:ribonuclease HI [Aquella oligotrophica]AUR51972.1 ribonuclease HI [Aquella oligotrophica]